jgi:DtxR family Mn-dependent transcriptional regulator
MAVHWMCTLSLAEISKTMEQYIETIYELQQEWGAASVTDIASSRGVKSPSVTYVLRKLKRLGLVNYKKYRSVSLTSNGLEIAKNLERTHNTLRWFLEMIGVDSEVANRDACELEHIARPETVERLTQFVDWVKDAPKIPSWLEHYREFLATGNHSRKGSSKSKK